MARYRTYRNGITGHRYKGYYIIRGEEKGLFQIWNEDKSVFRDNIYDYDECEWTIDKEIASPEDMHVIKQLYDMEIFKLSGLMLELISKKDRQGLDQKNKELYDWCVKVRKRKAEERKF